MPARWTPERGEIEGEEVARTLHRLTLFEPTWGESSQSPDVHEAEVEDIDSSTTHIDCQQPNPSTDLGLSIWESGRPGSFCENTRLYGAEYKAVTPPDLQT